MKIFNSKNDVVFEGKFDVSMLDLQHSNDLGDSIKVQIIDDGIIQKMQDLSWSLAELHDWIATDDDKTRVWLYIDCTDNSFSIQIESYPFLPRQSDIDKELDGMNEDERQSVEVYYDEIKDWYSENNSGEFDSVKVEFTQDELCEIKKVLSLN